MANVRAKRVCSDCGEVFRPTQHMQHRCAACIHAPKVRATPVPWGQCRTCEAWIIQRWGRTFCSDACRARFHSPAVTHIEHGTCAHCSAPFIRRAGQLGRYCSRTCIKRADKRHRRHLERAGGGSDRIDVAKLGERDGWVCAICGEHVDRMATAPMDWSPTVDHITPVSLGGRHRWENVQLAHFWCNAAKGADPAFTLRPAA